MGSLGLCARTTAERERDRSDHQACKAEDQRKDVEKYHERSLVNSAPQREASVR